MADVSCDCLERLAEAAHEKAAQTAVGAAREAYERELENW